MPLATRRFQQLFSSSQAQVIGCVGPLATGMAPVLQLAADPSPGSISAEQLCPLAPTNDSETTTSKAIMERFMVTSGAWGPKPESNL
jgi:hypothetical protein